MYLSHPVRRMREDPIPDATVELVVELGGASPGDLEAALEGADGDVVQDLGFDSWLVRVPEPAVADLCDLEGIDAIQTGDAISLDTGDAGEDL